MSSTNVSRTRSTNLMAVHRQWASRPDDERFLSLDDVYDDAKKSADRATVEIMDVTGEDFEIAGHGNERLVVLAGGRVLVPTHHAFGQLAGMFRCPADYLRDLHPELAAMNLNYSAMARSERNEGLFLFEDLGRRDEELGADLHMFRAITSPSYGRVWDHEVAGEIREWAARHGGRWRVPSASYQDRDPLLATTLYRGDRSMLLFLVDEEAIEVGKTADGRPDRLSRGVIVYNSEVRDSLLGVLFFYYRFVCDNRIVWGASNVEFVGIRHTSGAPDRWRQEIIPALDAFAAAGVKEDVETIRRAQQLVVGKTDEEVTQWLLAAGLRPKHSAEVIEMARKEEGAARTLWQLVNGATALARSIPYAHERMIVEQGASALLNCAA